MTGPDTSITAAGADLPAESSSPPLISPPTTPDALVRTGVIIGLISSVVLPVFAWQAPGGMLADTLAVVLAFTAAGPSVAALATGHSRALWVATAPATSLALIMLISLAQVLADVWSPPITATVVGMIGAAAAVHWLRRNPGPLSLRAIPRPGLATLGTLLAIAVAMGLWWWSTTIIDLDAAGATGLIAVLPWQWFAALAILMATFALLLGTKRSDTGAAPLPHGLLFLTAIATAVMITLTVNVADAGGVFGTGYVHVGFAESINQRGALLRGFDARFSWPSFFTAAAAIGAWAGLPDTSVFVIAHPAVLMACYLPPIAIIGRAMTGSARAGWLGALLFVFANWGQQDYFSPQSTALLLYLAVLAVLLHEMATTPSAPVDATAESTDADKPTWPRRVLGWVRGGAARFIAMLRHTPAAPAGWSGRTVLRVEALLLLLAGALVTQHQLTPVALIIVLAGWSLLGRTRHRGLWLGVGIIFAAWFAFGAYDWWAGHLQILLDGLGKPDQALSSGVADRLRGDATFVAMQRLRIGWSALLSLGALIGWLLLRHRFSLAAAAVPVIAPISLVFGQSYGGEMVLRVFLYASPFFAVFTAYALLRGVDKLTSRRAVIAGAMTILLAGTGVLGITARGVNVAFERTPADVIVAARNLLEIAPYRSTVRPLALEGSLRVGRVGEIFHPYTIADPDASEFVNLMRQYPDYIFLTSTREAYERIVNEAPEGYFADIAEKLENTGRYQVIERTKHVIVLERNSSDGRSISSNPGVQPIPRTTSQGNAQ